MESTIIIITIPNNEYELYKLLYILLFQITRSVAAHCATENVTIPWKRIEIALIDDFQHTLWLVENPHLTEEESMQPYEDLRLQLWQSVEVGVQDGSFSCLVSVFLLVLETSGGFHTWPTRMEVVSVFTAHIIF